MKKSEKIVTLKYIRHVYKYLSQKFVYGELIYELDKSWNQMGQLFL